jgi:hypothetical protein
VRGHEEDAGHGRERELQPRVVEAMGVPDQQGGGAEAERPPGVARTARDQGQAARRAGHPGAHHARVRSHDGHVDRDRGDGDREGLPAASAQRPRREHDERHEQRHVPAGDGHQVREARGPQIGDGLRAHALVRPEREPAHDGAGIARPRAGQRVERAEPQAVGEAPCPAAHADRLEAAHAQDGAHALPREPRGLVEAVV